MREIDINLELDLIDATRIKNGSKKAAQQAHQLAEELEADGNLGTALIFYIEESRLYYDLEKDDEKFKEKRKNCENKASDLIKLIIELKIQSGEEE